jgi:hypothetical protein
VISQCSNPHSQRITKWKWSIHPSNTLGVIIQANGVRKYIVQCPECETSLGTPSKDIVAELVRRGYEPVVLRVNPPMEYGPCSYRDCVEPGIDMHHWAPRNVFGCWDCDNWPVSYLCKSHHSEWHSRMDGYRRNAKRSESVEQQDRALDGNSWEFSFRSRRLAQPPPEWGTTALDPLYRLQTLRDSDELLLAGSEIVSLTDIDQ